MSHLVEIEMDPAAGFDASRLGADSIGHIISLTVGSITLDQNIEVEKPDDETSDDVAAILEKVTWTGEPEDAISFTCRVTGKSHAAAVNIAQQDLSNVKVAFQLRVFSFDETKRLYYKSFFADKKDLKGYVRKVSKEFERPSFDFKIGAKREATPASPENWKLSIAIVPEPGEQTVHYATAHLAPFVKKWGIPKK
jgi:hypothetical protein